MVFIASLHYIIISYPWQYLYCMETEYLVGFWLQTCLFLGIMLNGRVSVQVCCLLRWFQYYNVRKQREN